MNYFEPITRVFGNLKGFYSGINGATLTGAIDVIVVEQPDGTFKCSPFHVRFGKLGVLRSKEKVVDIEVNGLPVAIRMKLGDSGEAFFVEEIDSDDELEFNSNLATSPIPTSTLDQLTNDLNSIVLNSSGDITLPPASAAPNNTTKKRRRKRKKNSTAVSASNSKNDLQQGSVPPLPVQIPTSESPPEGGVFQMDEDYHQEGSTSTPTGAGVLLASEDSPEDEIVLSSTNLTHSRSFHRDFYSDTEVDGNPSPKTSRPSTPIQSDSEYEINKTSTGDASVLLSEDSAKWRWGEFPNSNPTTPCSGCGGTVENTSETKQLLGQQAISTDDEGISIMSKNSTAPSATSKRSMLSGMFSFMKPSRSTQAETESQGIYLDEINLESMDPQEFAMYFPNTKLLGSGTGSSAGGGRSEDDTESGKGNSLPQSPQPGSSPKASPPEFVTSMESVSQSQCQHHQLPRFEAISLCGENLALFEQSEVTYDELVENPELILQANPESIVLKVDGKFVPWSAALPQLLSTMFFRRPLPGAIVQKLTEQYSPKESSTPVTPTPPAPLAPQATPPSSKPTTPAPSPTKSQQPASNNSSPSPNASPARSENGQETNKETDPKRPGFWSSFTWRRSYSTSSATNQNLPQNQQQQSQQPLQKLQESEHGDLNQNQQNNNSKISGTSSSDESEGGGGLDENNKSGRTSRISTHAQSQSHTVIKIPGADKYRKTLRLNSDEIKMLRLRPGQNEAVFSVTTAYQGTTIARCHIYLWKHDDRIVVSDIDGTITKSDVLGHILPIIGNDWAQSGVAQLFTQIQANGYKMLYLSARAIGQAQITREYLRSIRQGDVTLPDGPLLLNPTSLMSAFHREVIEKKPEEFKIACLKDVQLLFPASPFYAGYGNRINDVWAYRAVDIAISRIFTINHRGELRHALTNTFQSSYTSLVELAEHIFPPYKDGGEDVSSHGMEGYGAFEFWREPCPSLGSIISQQIVEREALLAALETEGLVTGTGTISSPSRRYSNPLH